MKPAKSATTITSYKDLIVWQKSMDLVVKVYEITQDFPKAEVYGITSQMRRCAISIPSNIAEGSRKGSSKDFSNYLRHAFSSGAELETQIEICLRLGYLNKSAYEEIVEHITEVQKMLNALISKLSKTTNYSLRSTN
jgi:four helix bundle protein